MERTVIFAFLLVSVSSLFCQMDKQSQYACICSASKSNCSETIKEIPTISKSDVVIFETSQDSKERIKQIRIIDGISYSANEKSSNAYKFNIDLERRFQKIIGFGGALTDSSFLSLNTLKGNAKQEIFEGYYGKGGLEYNMGRVPIASTDFSSTVYSYCDEENDLALDNFSIDVDRSATTGFKLKNIKDITRIVESTGKRFYMFGSPWAPPSWMTNTGKVTKNPKLSDDPAIKKSYSSYLRRFFEEYQKEGVEFWGMTAQNEPNGNLGSWQSLVFTPQEQRNFIRDYLGPEVKTAFPHMKIMMHDDQRFVKGL